MLDSVFADVADFTTWEMILCTLVSLGLGLVVSLIYMYRNPYSKNLAVTLVLLPPMVQTVIALVNGNLGTGVAVMGAFGLVRFRSAPGTAREIACIFFSMAIGLATAMGYLQYAVLFTLLVGAAMLLLAHVRYGERKGSLKHLKVTLPEDLDYSGIFEDLFQTYTTRASLDKVKTTNLGSLFELQYTIELKDESKEKELIDAIRCRNGNLNIICGKVVDNQDEL